MLLENKDILDTIGYHGPHIIFILTLSQIWRQTPYLLTFLGGFFVNKYMNELLKELFEQPRPQAMDLAAAQSRDIVFQLRNYMGYAEPHKLYVSNAHVYGMPSGHAQSVGYALGFLYFTKRKQLNTLPITSTLVIVFLVEIFICAVTMYQRWESKAHTVAQITLGLLIGLVISGVVYTATHRFLVKQLRSSTFVVRRFFSAIATEKSSNVPMDGLSRKNIA